MEKYINPLGTFFKLSIPLVIALFQFFQTNLFTSEELNYEYARNQICYLVQKGEVSKGIELYKKYIKNAKKHDFPTLEQIGKTLIEQGAKSNDEESLLLAIYGLNSAGSLGGLELYELGINSHNPSTQIATIKYLANYQDDYAEELLFKAFSSPYLQVRMEASVALALKKSEKSIGIIESLMYKLPPYAHIYFPGIFAAIGTKNALSILKKMFAHSHQEVRLSAISSAAKYHYDEFLAPIRSGATHSECSDQEVCACALGVFKDYESINQLKILANSQSINVMLAASNALIQLGHEEYTEKIKNCALDKQPLAIPLLSEFRNSEHLLAGMLSNSNYIIKLNAALSLLKMRSSYSLPVIKDILVGKNKSIGYIPAFSQGRSLMIWKTVSNKEQLSKKYQIDIPAITHSFKEQLLISSLELCENDFISLAKDIFLNKEYELIPLTTELLENLNTTQSMALLEEQSSRIGEPLIRAYSNLALYRINGEERYKNNIYKWIKNKNNHDLFKFRDLLPFNDGVTKDNASLLTPDETSKIMIDSLESLIQNNDINCFDLLIDAIEVGNKKNRFVLAGLLLKAIQ